MKLSKESKKVLSAIEKFQPVRPIVLVSKLGISKKNLYKHINNLLGNNLITKTGTNGKAFYSISEPKTDVTVDTLSTTDLLIEQNYIYVSPSGEIIRGVRGFKQWSTKNNTKFENQKKLYAQSLKKIKSVKKEGLISSKGRILSGSKKICLNSAYFSNFYTFNHFGKTKLGQLVYVAKSSQNKDLIQEISDMVKPSILKLIEKHEIKYVCYIPPTIDRKVQIMEELEKSLNLKLPKIKIEKVASQTKIAQKTLRKLEDRIINAQKTIALDPNQKINGNVLIIDDATGSGATLNETCKKIQNITEKKIKIIGYTVVGSYKGFDVISEV